MEEIIRLLTEYTKKINENSELKNLNFKLMLSIAQLSQYTKEQWERTIAKSPGIISEAESVANALTTESPERTDATDKIYNKIIGILNLIKEKCADETETIDQYISLINAEMYQEPARTVSIGL